MAEQTAFEDFGELPEPALNTGEYSPTNRRHSRHRALRRVAEADAIPLLRKVIERAMSGDMYAARIVLDRVWPRPRTSPIALDMPAARTPGELRESMFELLERVKTGELTTDDGAAMVAMMRDILEAQSIQTLDSDKKTVTIDARRLLGDRLARIAAARPAAEPDEPAEQTA